MKVDIIREYDDIDDVFLGTVEVLQDHYDQQRVMDEIEMLWDDFQATQPNCDSEFILYLVEKRDWLFQLADSNVVVFLS